MDDTRNLEARGWMTRAEDWDKWKSWIRHIFVIEKKTLIEEDRRRRKKIYYNVK